MSKERKGCLDLPEPLHGLSLYTVPTSCLLCCFFCNYFHEGIFKSIFFLLKYSQWHYDLALKMCFVVMGIENPWLCACGVELCSDLHP